VKFKNWLFSDFLRNHQNYSVVESYLKKSEQDKNPTRYFNIILPENFMILI